MSRVSLTQRGAENNMVGVKGFEPSTSCSQSRRATQAALHPDAHIIALHCLSVNCLHCFVSAIIKVGRFEKLNASYSSLLLAA